MDGPERHLDPGGRTGIAARIEELRGEATIIIATDRPQIIRWLIGCCGWKAGGHARTAHRHRSFSSFTKKDGSVRLWPNHDPDKHPIFIYGGDAGTGQERAVAYGVGRWHGSAAEGPPRLWSRGVMAMIAVLVAVLGAGSPSRKFRKPSKRKALLFPPEQVRAVQHLEGGIVLEVLAKEGQLVEEGAVLLRLDPAQIKARYEQARIGETALKLKAERLRAIGDGRESPISVSPTPPFRNWFRINGRSTTAFSGPRKTAGSFLSSAFSSARPILIA